MRQVRLPQNAALRLLPIHRDPPDQLALVVADEERSVSGYRDTHWASPHAVGGRDESGQKVLVLTSRHAVLDRHTDDLVARPAGAIPGAVLGGKRVSVVLGGKLGPRVEDHLERRG